jgi:hypothetical protein
VALAPLATTADLTARKIDTSESAAVAVLLASASAAVRDAAGCSISRATVTVQTPGTPEQWLTVPGWAVTAVEDVLVDDVAATFKMVGGRLWRACGWQPGCEPTNVTMTITEGVVDVPADIIDLVCSLVAGGLSALEDEYDPKRGMSYERIDDYQYGMQTGDDEIVSPMELPERTKASLAQRFGNSAFVTEGA